MASHSSAECLLSGVFCLVWFYALFLRDGFIDMSVLNTGDFRL